MNAPILDLARQQLIETMLEIEQQVSQTRGHRPILTVLKKAREEAAVALAALIEVDPTDAKVIMLLQNEVKRFSDLLRWTRELVVDGKAAEDAIDENERELIEEYLRPPPGEEPVEDEEPEERIHYDA